MKNLLSYLLVSLVVSTTTLGIYHYAGWGKQDAALSETTSLTQNETFTVANSNLQPAYSTTSLSGAPTDFHIAADEAMPAVVHITAKQTVNAYANDPFYELFGWGPRRGRQGTSTGSGVILSADGYIVTNNHVIKDADELNVTLFDNRTYSAKVIGTDPSTDLGLIKIEAAGLPAMTLANSDAVRVGEWVLAVGNPFNLASTATAGIVSAIGRDLEIIKDQMAIESFIQTDAAVNPGNSGGALVNLEGHLIGVNTAIASPTGAYAGYAFAVPANIVKKVVSDLKEFGNVQRAFLGVSKIRSLNGDIARSEGLDITEGVLIDQLASLGGAYKGGLDEGDVIVGVNGIEIKNDAKLRELVARNRPGDKIDIKVYRDGRYLDMPIQLTNSSGETSLNAFYRSDQLTKLGVEFRDLTDDELARLQIDNGVLVSRLHAGTLRQQTDIKENFIILQVNEEKLDSTEKLTQILEQESGKVKLTGFYPRAYRLVSYVVEL
ncbi:MAG: trypsin-like peptidase domain-containing protein [Bacteroidota bacterium]